ncbi:MAG: TcfC E-set like domain-containing protein [Endozoicomonas sp.]|uniref:TcfC E-set like domain-containing protein n=1 Tax=Endozoicomonas sp. TaxID=1892382 RepID=UPI003D9AFF5D
MRRWLCKRIIIITFSIFSVAHAVEPLFIASSNPPPGFEDLSQTQQSLVDVYFGNRYITSQLASFRPGFFQFSSTVEIIQSIGNINDQELIGSALSGELNANEANICRPDTGQPCQLLEPPIAGVVFDESRFRVDIFINPRFMLSRAAAIRKYLPPSDAGFAMMQTFSAAVSGSDAENRDDDYTLNGLTMLALRENSLLGSWDYSKSNHLSVTQLFGQREFEGLEYSLGLLNSEGFGLNFTSDQKMVGARISTSSNTREDGEFTGGMPVEIFLPVRGRVEIRKDGRLIASSFYEAGVQQLDTSSYPSGAYDIEIRVLDEQGNEVSRETRFFAKQYQLPPVGEWLLFAETGQVMNSTTDDILPVATQQWLSRAGLSRRLHDTLAGTVAIASTRDSALFEAGLYHLGYRYELSPSFMWSDEGSYGGQLSARTWLGSVSLGANYRHLWRDEPFEENPDRPSLLGNSFEQQSFSATTPLGSGTLGFRYSFNRSGDDQKTETQSLDYRYTLFRSSTFDISSSLSLSKTESSNIALLSFEFRFKQNRWNFNANPRFESRNDNGQSDRSESLRLSTNWADGDLYDGDLRVSGGITSDRLSKSADSSIQYANRFGRASFNILHSISDDDDITSYGGSFNTSFLTDGNVFAMGGEQVSESALVVNLSGREGDVFDVKVNGQRRGYAVAGEPSVISLSPFDQYSVVLSPAGNTLYSFDEREKQVTLYPGNVVTLDYEAIPLQLLFGRVLFKGRPVSRAKITGGLYPGNTDDIGMFQVESRSNTGALSIELDNGWVCQLPVEPLTQGYVQQMGTIELESTECKQILEGQLAITKRGDQS